MKKTKIAVVSGGNRGIGWAICHGLARQGLHVVLTARRSDEAEAAAAKLRGEGLVATAHPLDVSSDESVQSLAAFLQKQFGAIDVVVNNAGISMDGFNGEVAEGTLGVNLFGAMRLTDTLLPLLAPHGRVVMVSSGMGDRSSLQPALRARFAAPETMSRAELLALMQQFIADVRAGRHSAAGWPTSAYRVSKIGMNVFTAIVARELQERGDPRHILVNAACPGWVRTAMGGPHAMRSPEEGADTPIWLAGLPDDGPQGGFFRDRSPASW